MFGSIEFGGTKIRCAIIDENGNLIDQIRINTSKPEINIKEIEEFYKNKRVVALGVGAFGPIDINKNSASYGVIKNTPKQEWIDFNLLKNLSMIIDTKIEIVTDVGLSAIGEYNGGAGKNYQSMLYLTIGTGIGGAYIQDGKIINGLSHPEMGHIDITRDPDDHVKSVCMYHDNCLEGLASGPSIKERKGVEATQIDINDLVFDTTSNYIAKALYTYSLILRPNVIILGGGLMNKDGFIQKVRDKFDKLKGDYIDLPSSESYIIKPKLGDDSALVGGYYLAKQLVND